MKENVPLKKLFNSRPLFFSCLPLTIGILFGTKLSLPISCYLIPAGIFLFAYFFFNGKWLKRGLMFALVLVAGLSMSAFSLIKEYPDVDIKEYHTVYGRVTEKSQREGYTAYNLSQVTIDGEEIRYNILVSSQTADYQIDDYILSFSLLSIPKSAPYAAGYDDYLYCCSKNVAYRANSRVDYYARHAHDVASVLHGIRYGLSEKISQLFPKNAPLAKTLIIGDETELDPDTKDLFSLSGLAHIITISGSHIFMFFAAFGWAMDKCAVPYKTGLLIQNIFLWAYAALIGFRVSILRAAVMCQADLLIRFLFQKRDGLTSAAVAYWVILLINPLQIFDLGFQLTYAAIYGLNLFLDRKNSRELTQKDKLKRILAPSVAANAGLFPILVNTSNYVWIPGLAVNTLASYYSIYLIPILTILTAIYLILGKYVLFLGAIGDLLIGALRFLAGSYVAFGKIGFYLRDFAPILAAAWFIGMFLVSGRTFLKPRAKAAVALCTSAVCLLYCALPVWKLNTAVRLQNNASAENSFILYTEDARAYLIGASKDGYVARYALDQGIRFEAAYIYSKDPDTLEETSTLYEHHRVKQFYASEGLKTVLENKLTLSVDIVGGERISLSNRCAVQFIKANPDVSSKDFIGACVFFDGAPAALILSETPERLPEGLQNVKIIYYGADVSEKFLSGVSYSRAVALQGADVYENALYAGEAGTTTYYLEKDLFEAAK